MTNVDVIYAWCDRLAWHCSVPTEWSALMYAPHESQTRRSIADLTEAVRARLVHSDLSVVSSVLDLWGWRTPVDNLRAALQVVL